MYIIYHFQDSTFNFDLMSFQIKKVDRLTPLREIVLFQQHLAMYVPP